MISSYEQNNYGEIFYAIIRAFQPINCIELGVLNGYSASYIARALKDNGRGVLNIYDLFEEYPYKAASKSNIESLFFGNEHVHINQGDGLKVYENYQTPNVDFLHVDISNHGDIVNIIMDQWDSKMVQGGIICFEGGSEERDKIEWMKKYDKTPIKPVLEANKVIERNYIFGTYFKFPALTMLLKKR